jgi:hypothetical protein
MDIDTLTLTLSLTYEGEGDIFPSPVFIRGRGSGLRSQKIPDAQVLQ